MQLQIYLNPLLNMANNRSFIVYILGSTQINLELAIKNISIDYPRIKIFAHHGYYNIQTEHKIVEIINQKRPDMVFVALPSPKKEEFIYKYKNKINSKLFLGVGGAIDIKAKKIKRAPLFLRNIGLEGLHRSLQNPLNYGKRIFIYYPRFLKIIIKYKK